MRKYLIISCFVLLPFFVEAQTVKRIPYRTNDLWGLVDQEGKPILSPTYEEISFFQNGLFIVKQGSKNGLIDAEGGVIIPPIYDLVHALGEFNYLVSQEGKAGVIDREGKFIVPLIYDDIRYLHKSRYFEARLNGKYGLLDEYGAIVVSIVYNAINVKSKSFAVVRVYDKFQLFDLKKKQLLLEVYDDIVYTKPYYLVNDGVQWGMLDRNGHVLISNDYDQIRIQKGFCILIKNGKIGLSDMQGSVLLKAKHHSVYYRFNDQIYWFTIDGTTWFQYDAGTNKRSKIDYDKVIDTVDGYVRVMQGNYMRLIDQNLNELPLGNYYEIKKYNSVLYSVQYNKKWGLVNHFGTVVLPIGFDVIRSISSLSTASGTNERTIATDRIDNENDRFGKVKKVDAWGLINDQGKLLSEIKYQNISIGGVGYPISVMKNGLFGVLDSNGNEIVTPKFEQMIWDDTSNSYKINESGKWGLIDSEGDVLLLPKYETIEFTSDENSFFVRGDGKLACVNRSMNGMKWKFEFDQLVDLKNGYVLVSESDRQGIYSIVGTEVLPLIYNSVSLLSSNVGNIFWLFETKGLYGLANEDGSILLPTEYEHIEFAANDLLKVVSKGKQGYVSLKGRLYYAQ